MLLSTTDDMGDPRARATCAKLRATEIGSGPRRHIRLGQPPDLPLGMVAPILAILSANETTWYSIMVSASPAKLYLSGKLVREEFMAVHAARSCSPARGISVINEQ